MKHVLLLVVCALLAGCPGKTIVKPQVVYVNKPVWYCPMPPAATPLTLNTPTLTSEDKKDPGKVAQFYKADMILLTDAISRYEAIIEQYRKSGQEAEELQKKMEQVYQENHQKSDGLQPTP